MSLSQLFGSGKGVYSVDKSDETAETKTEGWKTLKHMAVHHRVAEVIWKYWLSSF